MTFTRARRLGLRAARVWRGHSPFWIEIVTSLVTFAWGQHVLASDLAENPSYRTVARWAPDELWSAVGMVGGLLQVCAALVDHVPARAVIAWAMLAYWLLLVDGLHRTTPDMPGLVLYLGMVLYNAVPALRLSWRLHGG